MASSKKPIKEKIAEAKIVSNDSKEQVKIGGKMSIKDKFQDFMSKLPGRVRKACKYILIAMVLVTFYFALRLPRLNEGYMDGLSYQDEAFCDKIMNSESFTIQDFYFIRQYYNEGKTKAEFCAKLIGTFDSQYKQYLEEEQNKQKEENKEDTSKEETKTEDKQN